MDVDLLLVVDHLARPCGVRTTYLKFLEWCHAQRISLALISDTTESFPFDSIRARLNITVDDGPKISQLRSRPLISLIDDSSELIYPELITMYGISEIDAFQLDAWNGNNKWLAGTEEKCKLFLKGIRAKKVLIATQSFIGFAVSFLLKAENAYLCLHTNYASAYAIRITSYENDLFQSIVGKINERLHLNFVKYSKRIFLVSEASSRFFQLNGSHEVQLFTPGVDTMLFKPVSKKENRSLRILFGGRWAKDKGTGFFSKLFHELDSIEWTIVGNEDHETNLPANVRLLGLLDHESLAEEMALSDIVIFYGKWDTFGLVAVEALSCGVPVLSHCESEIARLLERYQCGSSFTSMNDLVDLIRELESDRHQLMIFGHNAREFAENFTWDRSIALFVEKLGI